MASANSEVVLSQGKFSELFLWLFSTTTLSLKCQSSAVVLAHSGDVVPEGRHRLLQWDLYDVLFDNLALRNRDDLGGPLTAQSREGAAPGEWERAPESHLHGLAAGNLAPFPRLALQTLDSLQRTKHRGLEAKGKKKPKLYSTLNVFWPYMQNCDTRRKTKASTLPWLHCLGLFLRQ